tara:strand:+ start:100 stop:714 length:615 start_codon:yes stop_codon:yes gene_type:complete
MATKLGPNIVTDGLLLALDAGSLRSYPGSGTTWKDLSDNGFDFSMDGSGITYNSSDGTFSLTGGGASYADLINAGERRHDCTFVYWIKTNDSQALFWQGQTTSYYLGAYHSGNKEYYNLFGSGIEFYKDTVDTANIYDHIRDNQWHMLEFKGVDVADVTQQHFNQYGSFEFQATSTIGAIMIYSKSLTAAESTRNYNALKNRFA